MRRMFSAASVVPWLIPLVLIAVLVAMGEPRVRWAYEDVSYVLSPSAEHAFAIAERSLNARSPREYDFARAEKYYREAERLDPTLPFLYHELSRVSFLKGDFAIALARINVEIARHGDTQPRSYYIRGLVEGYMGLYDAAVDDFAHFLRQVPPSWAGANDYAWALLKAGRPAEAVDITNQALAIFPNNPWLLNSAAIARAEVGDAQGAREAIRRAARSSLEVTEADWLYAYPGNDPAIASEGVHSLQTSILRTMHSLNQARSGGRVQL